MLGFRSLFFVGAPLVALVATTTASGSAEACLPDPCESSNRFSRAEVVGTIIAPDGVVRLDARRRYYEVPMEDVLPFVDVQVTGPGGPVDGALEYQPLTETVVWRPAEAFDPLTSYDVTVAVDNDALALAFDYEGIAEQSDCGQNIAVAAELTTSETGLPPLDPPMPASESSHEVEPVEWLDAMVCCDGAYPWADILSCIDAGADVHWDEGHCATSRAYGQARATQSFSDKDFPLHVTNDLVLRLIQTEGPRARFASPGELSVWVADDEPFCADLHVYSLATGETWTGPQFCYGDDVADQLGSHDIDPTDALAVCEGQPYTCEDDGAEWDPEACMPWGDPPGSDETGGDGTGDDGGTDDGDGTGDGDGNATGDDGDGDGTGGDTTPQDGDGVNGRGCACRTRSDDSLPFGSWLLLAGLWGWRSRRRSAAARDRCA